MIVRPKKDLVEVFGYAPDDMTKQSRSLWGLSACPFVNKQCTKTNHDGSIVYGTCSVSSPFGDCVICPNRLYENKYATLRRIAAEAFDKELDFLLFEQYIPLRGDSKSCVVALGQNSGKEVKIGKSMSMDWVLARIEKGKLVEYTGVEVQSIDITGNYRDSWYAYKNLSNKTIQIPASEHGLNWANVHKRLIPQIIRKGTIYSRSDMVKSGLHFVAPDIVFQKFEEIIGADIPLVKHGGKDVLTIHTYELSPFVKHGEHRSLIMKRNIKFSLDEFSQRFVSGPNLPAGDLLDHAVRRVLGINE
jgi:Restriction endonuclease NotI